MSELVYPGECAKCGRRWGDHLTHFEIQRRGGGCPFYPLPGEIDKPMLKENYDRREENQA